MMESHEPRAIGSRLGTAAEPTFHTGRHARWRSQRHVQEILDEMKANKEKWVAADAKWVAEEERRRNSPLAERLKEDGQELLREFEDNLPASWCRPLRVLVVASSRCTGVSYR
jgi:hypothetical protein